MADARIGAARTVADRTVAALLDEHGRTFAAEAGIRLKDTPVPLFELLVLADLLSVNVSAHLGVRAARALREAGLTSAAKMADAGADERWQVLSDAKYLRKRQTADRLGTLAEQAQQRWGGDLRRLRDEAQGSDDPAGRTGELLQDFTGIGRVGADIFCREVQAVWPGLAPFADERMLGAARDAGLPDDVDALVELAGGTDLSVLGAALIRSTLS